MDQTLAKHERRLKVFVEGFVKQFELKLDEYKDEVEGRVTKPGRTSKLAKAAGAGAGGIAAASAQVAPGIGTAIGGALSGPISKFIGEKAHLRKASVLVEVTQILSTGDNGQGLRKVLVNSGVSIFHKFEAQFMKDKEIEENETCSIVTLAIGAMERVMNYINERGVFPEDTEPVSEELITKGLILGKSKGYIGQHFPKRELKVWKIEFKIRFYEDPHVIFEWKPNVYYYYSKTPKIDSNGFRFRFDWEGEVEKKSKEWVIEVFHEYILRKEVLLGKANHHFDRINKDDPARQLVQIGETLQVVAANSNICQVTDVGKEFSRGQTHSTFHTNVRENDFPRRADLERLDENLKQDRPIWTPRVTIVYGLGGIGKTELVKIFASTYGKRVLWINAGTRATMLDSFRRLAKDSLNIRTMDANGIEMGLDSIQDKVYTKLAGTECIFVFDDLGAEHKEDVTTELWKTKTNFDVVITSRISEWPHTAVLHPLLQPTEADAISVVNNGLLEEGSDEVPDSPELVRRLHCFPLALEQAIAYIRNERVTDPYNILDYLQAFGEKTKEFLDSNLFQSYNDYGKTTFTTWQITIDRIRVEKYYGTLALEILNEICFLDHQGIRREWFITGNRQPDAVKGAMRLLVKYSMVNSEHPHQKVLSVHPLVQEVGRLSLGPSRVMLILQSVGGMYLWHISNPQCDNGERGELRRHLEIFLCRANKYIKKDPVMYREFYECTFVPLKTSSSAL